MSVRAAVPALRRPLPVLAVALGLLAILGAGAAGGASAREGRQDDSRAPVLRSPLSDDPRSTILLRHDCRSELGRREVTLFADGVVRLREAAPAEAPDRDAREETMRLHTLDPDSLAAYRERLAEEDLSEVRVERSPVEGEWVERCVLDLLHERPGGPPEARRFRFSPYSALPLALSRIVRIAEELAAEASGPAGPGLPRDYEPRPGDVLERVDGVLFEVVASTVEGKGVELIGRESPLTLYVPVDELRDRFVRLVSRRSGRR